MSHMKTPAQGGFLKGRMIVFVEFLIAKLLVIVIAAFLIGLYAGFTD